MQTHPTAPTDPAALVTLLKGQAFGLGFDLCGIATLGPMETADAFDAWVSAGYAGEMHYLPRWADKRRDSRLPFEGVTSAIVVAMQYGGREPAGPVARYARGVDYHDVMVERLRELHRWIEQRLAHPVRGKAYVDTGPLLERDLARRAGLGWFGKNTNLINPTLGSFFFLGALVVDLELPADAPFEADRCGTCTRCLDACPTDAFVEPRLLDATKCISYLTIEAKGAIPDELRAPIGDRLYGCDVCQEVCPWNRRFAKALPEGSPYAARDALLSADGESLPRAQRRGLSARELARELLAMTQEEFSAAFKGSPMKRAKLRGLKRNAAVVLGNVGTAEDVELLARVCSEELDGLVREHVAWALGAIASPEAIFTLRAQSSVESEVRVLDAIRLALARADA